MGSGYVSGWMEQVLGTPFINAEVMCKKNKDSACRFIGATPSNLDNVIKKYSYEAYVSFVATTYQH